MHDSVEKILEKTSENSWIVLMKDGTTKIWISSQPENFQITGFLENGKEYPLSLPVEDSLL